jgi:hypothetical protein
LSRNVNKLFFALTPVRPILEYIKGSSMSVKSFLRKRPVFSAGRLRGRAMIATSFAAESKEQKERNSRLLFCGMEPSCNFACRMLTQLACSISVADRRCQAAAWLWQRQED